MIAALRMTGSLLKLRIGSFVALGALAGILVAEGRMGAAEAAVFTLAVLGASGAVGAFNHYHERATDRLMRRTACRPFANGTLKPGAIWPATFAALLAASLVMAWSVGGGAATLLVFLGALTYGGVYTVWLKRRTVWNIVIGGAAGSFAVLAGAAAAGGGIGPVALLLAVVLLLWTPPHFWSLAAARRDDYDRAGVPMLPVVAAPAVWAPMILAHIATLSVVALVPLAYGMGPLYGICAAAGGGYFTWRGWRLMRAPDDRGRALATFHASLMQFGLLMLGVGLDRAAAWLG